MTLDPELTCVATADSAHLRGRMSATQLSRRVPPGTCLDRQPAVKPVSSECEEQGKAERLWETQERMAPPAWSTLVRLPV